MHQYKYRFLKSADLEIVSYPSLDHFKYKGSNSRNCMRKDRPETEGWEERHGKNERNKAEFNEFNCSLSKK